MAEEKGAFFIKAGGAMGLESSWLKAILLLSLARTPPMSRVLYLTYYGEKMSRWPCCSGSARSGNEDKLGKLREVMRCAIF